MGWLTEDFLEYEEIPEHEHGVTDQSSLKFNGGNPVLLCGVEENCQRIVQYQDGREY